MLIYTCSELHLCKKIIVLKYDFKFVAIWNDSLIQNKLRYVACLQIIRI